MTEFALPRPLAAAARTRSTEPAWVTAIKALLYAFAIVLYLLPLSSWAGIGSALGMALGGLLLADLAHRRRLRLVVGLAFAPLLLFAALLLGDRLLDSLRLAELFGVEGTFIASDVVTFGLAGLAGLFVLRLLANRLRAFSLLEVLFVAGSVAFTLADHRNRMLNRPRFLSDWAWSLGIDPTTILIGVGAAATLAAALLFLRDQPFTKVFLTLLLLAALGSLFYLVSDKRIDQKRATDALGLSGQGRGGKGKNKGGKGGGQNNDNPFRNNYNSPPPRPVAIAILRDDYQPEGGVMYFRQRVLSRYNGVSLTADAKVDDDVIASFGQRGEVRPKHHQNPDHHVEVPTTMYLLVDHPQPPALTNGVRLKLVQNPNPQQFISAYEVRSLVLAVTPRRLLGRHSMPKDWSPAEVKHYTELPDDPRYRTLADIIARGLDPRYADDDLAKAFAIKRYLEKNGFYTRKSKHASSSDPTASFLFGSLRGYCVHFAHAAVYLFRSLGIASRVALGYAVQTRKRSGGSSILIMGDRAHAWPEIYLDGIGWITFDVYPERTDMPPPPPVDYDLEKLLGELARKDPTGGLSPEGKPWAMPWALILRSLAFLLLALLALGYTVKLLRRLLPVVAGERRYCRWAYLASLDRLSELGRQRRRGESRERHAERLGELAPHLAALTQAHLARALGSATPPDAARFRQLTAALHTDLKTNSSLGKRLLGLLDPFSWLRTR